MDREGRGAGQGEGGHVREREVGEAGHAQAGPGAAGVHGAVILLVRPVTHNVNLLLSRVHDN